MKRTNGFAMKMSEDWLQLIRSWMLCFVLCMTIVLPFLSINVKGEEPATETAEEVVDVQADDVLSHLTIVDPESKLSSDARARINEIFEKAFPKIWEYYHGGAICDVTVEVTKIGSNPAYTAGRKVTIDYEYANSNIADADFFTHELVHVAQLSDVGTYEAPTWLTEGIADFGRNKFGLYNAESGWKLWPPGETDYYTDSYTTTASFLNWIEKNKKTGFVKEINAIIQSNTFTLDTFEELAGADVDSLWDQYLTANGITVDVLPVTVPETKPIPAGTDLSAYLTITDKDGSLTEKMRNDIKKVFLATYGKIIEEYNYGTLYPVLIEADASYDGVAYTDCEHHKIVFSTKYLGEHPEDYDFFTHELVHIAQNYQGNIPGWLTEGIADYGRDQFGINNDKAGWFVPLFLPDMDGLDKGYKDAAGFLKWVAATYGKETLQKINAVCKDGSYRPQIWRQLTGDSISRLEMKYRIAKPTPQWVQKAGMTVPDLEFLDTKGNHVFLSSFKGKPILMFWGNWDKTNIYGNIDNAIKFHKEYGDKINILFVYFFQGFSPIQDLLKGYSEADLAGITFLNDPEVKSLMFTFGKREENGIGIGWPNIVVMDADLKLLFGEHQGCIYYPDKTGDELNEREKIADDCLTRLVYPNGKKPNAEEGKSDYTVIQDIDGRSIVEYSPSPDETASSVVIPNNVKIDGKEYAVVSVEKEAFLGNKHLKKIKIGNKVESIGEKAFSGCSNLTSVTFKGNSLKEIKKEAFANCKKLKSIDLGQNVRKIDAAAFKNCKSLKKIVFHAKAGKLKITKGAFKGINKKCRIIVPKKQYLKYVKLLKKAGVSSKIKILKG